MSSLIEEVKQKNDILETIGTYVKMTPAGSNFKGLCPFHREKTPSFMVSREKQIFHCFGCSKGGDVITFIQEIEGLEFKEALKILAEKAGLDYRLWQKNGFSQKNNDQREIVRQVLEKTASFFEEKLLSNEGKAALEYLKSRKVSEASRKNFRLGFAPNSFNALFDFLRQNGFTEKEILASGSVYKKDNQNVYVDRFRNRVAFPITDSLNRVVGFSARVLPGDSGDQGKYINTPQTDHYDKGALLYGFSQAKKSIRENSEVILLEGNLDVVLSHQAGISQSVATCGTALGEKQLKFLRRYVDKLILAFDADMAGVKATKRAAELAWKEEFDIKVIAIKKGKDVADLVVKSPDLWKKKSQQRKSVTGYFYDLSFRERELSLDQKKILTEKMLKLLTEIPSTVERSYYLKKLAEEVDVPENHLWEKVNQIIDKERGNNRWQKREDIGPQITPKNNRKLLLEERILGFIYAFPRLYFSRFDTVESLEFENRECGNLLEEIKIFLSGFTESEGINLKSEDLVFSSREASLKIKEIFLTLENELGQEFLDNVEKTEREFDANLKLLGKEMLTLRKNEILREIKKIQSSGSKEELKNLFDQMKKISSQIIS